ncbi:hypothetical protein N7536_003594 [Penicillium majusculum]|uniref:Protein kinase domain-containing protein n=1 Tax=Penicillium solitum TaxID=60172 RepID=A0A1V6RJN8_9EURO|nr:uncharacterized protein PENSOL_c003G03729 [Penicillium solitum]KAJ5700581.1 hypothetical protein N7536_003594 [Penicillium majusculum]OQE02025.1 hypothetical protein PENSOL_c003G03729 [Penicillium solitum]
MIGNSQLFLLGLQGTEVTLPSSDSLKIRGDTWVIDKKPNEVSCMITREDLDCGRTVPSYTMGKFLCHKVGALPESAFMRIHSQVPIEDTQFLSPEVRAQQAVPPYQHSEIMALKRFKEGGCTVVPELLGYIETAQGQDGLVPGGYITYLVWDKVPGQSLSRELFWSFNKPKRDLIRQKFRAAHEALTSFGYLSIIKTPAKLIWDQDSCQLHISGFSTAIKVDPTKKWNDDVYAMYQLRKRPKIGWEDIARWEW